MKHLHFTVEPVKVRRHRALFDPDLPFRGRSERPKTDYRRRPKHRNRSEDFELNR